MPLNPASFTLPPTTIMLDAAAPDVSCYWCRKIAAICDGQRTLQDLAEILYLPLNIVQKLAQKALDHGWLTAQGTPSTQASLFWQQVSAALENDQELLEKAAQMTRQRPGDISSGTIPNFLIALELLISDEQRDTVIPRLDDIRQKFELAS